MTKKDKVFAKFDGLCAYTGKPLGDDWQIDHQTSKYLNSYRAYYSSGSVEEVDKKIKEVDKIENLFPALKVVNHYKRSLDLEGFRDYMKTFHIRLAKYPKNPTVAKSIKRKAYMMSIAEAFGITQEKPFDGLFYFEKIKQFRNTAI